MKKVLLIIMCIGFFSCMNTDTIESQIGNDKKKSLAPVEFVKWVKDEYHGLKKEKSVGDIIFSAQYKPVEYVICMEEKSMRIADSVVKKKKLELGDMQYIDFKIAINSGQGELLKYELSSASQYEERVNYFSFKMQDDIKLLNGSDTISCALFHFERAYDVAPYSTFVLGFPLRKDKTKNLVLVYHDNIFKKGIIKLEFKNSNIKAIPKLKTE